MLTINAHLDRMQDLCMRGEPRERSTEAHALAGSAGNIGAVSVSRIARMIEDTCQTLNAQAIASLIADLDVAGDRASLALEAAAANARQGSGSFPLRTGQRGSSA